MQAPPVLENEARRLNRLRQLGVLDTEAEAVLDAFTQLASSITGMPIALISLIDHDRQWFKSAVGLPQGGQTPRSLSFCGHAIAADEVFEVEDARHDPRFADNPFVVNAPHVTHYAGAPLVMPDGERIGTLCVVGEQPGRLDPLTREQLVTLAQSVVRVLLIREKEHHLEKRLKTERALRESEARWRTITDLMPQIVWSSDAQGNEEAFNKRWEDFTGNANIASAGGPVHQEPAWMAQVHAEDREQVRHAWREGVAKGQPFEAEFRLRHRGGEHHWVLARALPVRDDDGHIVRWLGTFTDIHDQKRAQQALLDSNRQKDEFLAMLAHELRNPLAPISTAAQLLRLSAHDAARVLQTSELISRQVGHMTELVDDLLDVSRVTRGLVQIEHEEVDLRQVLHDALEQTQPQIDLRRHSLDLPVAAPPLRVLGDRVRLVQVLANLLNNAAKYTPDGGRLKVVLEAREREAVVRVCDNGSGIAPDLLPHVFELFTQATRTPDRAQGGLGVGLALVRSLVELHGGRVSAQSAGPGRGSTFTVVLPRLEADIHDAQAQGPAAPGLQAAPGLAPAPGPGSGPDDAGLRVMVVDDNADAAELLGIWLEAQGHDVTVCTDPYVALDEARRHPARVYVLDIGLPGMDGNALARKLREDPRNRDAALIALTGYGQAQDILQSREAGFDQHFVKPADPTRLATVIGVLAAERLQPGGAATYP